MPRTFKTEYSPKGGGTNSIIEIIEESANRIHNGNALNRIVDEVDRAYATMLNMKEGQEGELLLGQVDYKENSPGYVASKCRRAWYEGQQTKLALENIRSQSGRCGVVQGRKNSQGRHSSQINSDDARWVNRLQVELAMEREDESRA